MKKGRSMELMLFIAAILLVCLSGWLYFEKSSTNYSELRDEVATLNNTIINLEDDMAALKKPMELQTMNVVMKEPIKVYVKALPAKPKLKFPPIPGMTPKLKQQMDGLSK